MPDFDRITRAELFAVFKTEKLVRIMETLLATVATTTDTTAIEAALDAHILDATDAHQASAIGATPSGGLASNNVAGQLVELDTEKQPASATLTTLASSTAAGLALMDDADAIAQRATLGLGTLATQSGTFSGTSSGTNTGDQFTATTASRLIGRGSAAGAGAAQEIALGAGLSMSGTTVAATGKELLASVTLGSAGASLASGTISARQFLEIHIYIEGYAGSDTASLQFNGAAGTAYRYRWLTSAAGGTTFSAGLLAASTDRIKVAAVNTTASRRIVAHISNDSSVTEKLVRFEEVTGTGSAGTQATIDLGNGAWISGAATQITSVSLVSSSNMLAGTQMVIYGWN